MSLPFGGSSAQACSRQGAPASSASDQRLHQVHLLDSQHKGRGLWPAASARAPQLFLLVEASWPRVRQAVAGGKGSCRDVVPAQDKRGELVPDALEHMNYVLCGRNSWMESPSALVLWVGNGCDRQYPTFSFHQSSLASPPALKPRPWATVRERCCLFALNRR
ncbi:hypothetical protein H920_11665 [Fukomys damarensis]|uniref:Uncharacterized protein n=1 Tax=Fukomys damarensis TaxID=885580 RepID=A0A091D9I6_FUKDA|nr:hypothetical protein H920_11665 [Fukomys damarensis]